jgi:hypothetical protein
VAGRALTTAFNEKYITHISFAELMALVNFEDDCIRKGLRHE